ncbi:MULTISPECIES: type II toxin-antitoxin system RelE/ParE family toxin [unclassified Microcoleus]|uniref:type II toxin-antitoxin system RelE/ParE family toxin n=1 Tax=unclassified Microcoleus TaxID=2642155 RepID=UPI002FD6171E
MTIERQPIQIELTPRFQRDLRTLGKRYRNIRNDIQPVIEQLQAGELPGDRIPGMEYEIFKVRIKNSDIQKGKSAGYRAIYYLKTSDSIVLVTIYSKSDLSDIAAETVREILAQYEQQFPESEEL